MACPPIRHRIAAASLAVAAALAGAACLEERGTLSFEVSGPSELPAALAVVQVDWDGGAVWTRQVECILHSDWDSSDYELSAYDRSLGGGLEATVYVQDYQGPDTYERDEFQPRSVLAILYEDEETGEEWRLGADDGGVCSVELRENSRSAAFSCTGASLTRDGVAGEEPAEIRGEWSCGTLERRYGTDGGGGEGGEGGIGTIRVGS